MSFCTFNRHHQLALWEFRKTVLLAKCRYWLSEALTYFRASGVGVSGLTNFTYLFRQPCGYWLREHCYELNKVIIKHTQLNVKVKMGSRISKDESLQVNTSYRITGMCLILKMFKYLYLASPLVLLRFLSSS